MMVNCPKCGFSQPQDQYCASCGVDMLSYRPSRAPFLRRLVKSVPFQLIILVALIVGGFAFIRVQNRARLAQRIAQIENAGDTRIIDKTSGASDAASQAQSAQEGAPNAQPPEGAAAPGAAPAQQVAGESADTSRNFALQNPELAKSIKDAPTEAAPPPAPTATPAANAQAAAASTGERVGPPTKLRVAFLEINRTTLGELAAEGRGSSGYGSFSSGTFSNADAKLKSMQAGLKPLDSGGNQSLRAQQPILVFRGMRDETSGHDLGITVQATPVAVDDNGTTVQVEVLRVLRETGSNPPVGEQSFSENFQIPRGSAAYISGVLPHRNQLSDEETRIYGTNPVLRILNSPGFQGGTTEFVILLQPQ